MREKLPNRRPNENRTIRHQNVDIELSFGFDIKSNKLREVFVTTRKHGTAIDIMAKEITILLSFLLQYGCDMGEVISILPCDIDGKLEGLAGKIAQTIIKEMPSGK